MSDDIPFLLDLTPVSDSFEEEVVSGLLSEPKSLPSKFFYDEEGSRLFDRICQLDEYYPTRTETHILRAHVDDISGALGSGVILVEYGSGSSTKTQILLDTLKDPHSYVPIDISREHLVSAAEHLKHRYPMLDVLPVCADYSHRFDLGLVSVNNSSVCVFFPGSTIGNFVREHAVLFLKQLASVVGPGGYVLIGVDLEKDPDIIESAYNDYEGVTAAFNLNILSHINRRLGTEFDIASFSHCAVYNPAQNRIEMYLVSQKNQHVLINGADIRFQKGETICTEYSHKYSVPEFGKLVGEAGFDVEQVWTDDQDLFSLQLLRSRPE